VVCAHVTPKLRRERGSRCVLGKLGLLALAFVCWVGGSSFFHDVMRKLALQRWAWGREIITQQWRRGGKSSTRRLRWGIERVSWRQREDYCGVSASQVSRGNLLRRGISSIFERDGRRVRA
jgi:hypothetical protein